MKMRVLHILDSLDLGGAQVVVENLVRHADRARFEVEVATLHGRGVFWERIARLGVRVHSLSPAKALPIYLPRLLWLFATRRFDVVHCHLLGANVIAKPLAALCGVRVRINHDHCNDKSTLPAFARRLDRWTNRLSTHVVAVSESTRAYLLQHEQLAAERVTTVLNGISLDTYQPRAELRVEIRQQLGIPADAFVVGGIGRLVFQKNFALFLDAASQIAQRRPRAVFVIAGTGPEEAALRAQAARLALPVHFLGFVADTAQLYPALDCLLLTSRFEGLPITILEAMACRVPIVASDLDGMREVLRDGETAALVEPGEPAPYATRVSDFITHPAAALALAEAALALVRAKYSAEAMTRAVEAIYLQNLGA